MATITIIRHAQSEINANHDLPAELSANSRLSPKGMEQAADLDFKFDLLILTPLKRTLQTYTFSKIKTADVMINPLFRELMDGPANLLEMEEYKSESLLELDKRVDIAIAWLREISHSYKSIGIISHFHFLKFFRQKLGIPGELNANCAHLTFKLE